MVIKHLHTLSSAIAKEAAAYIVSITLPHCLRQLPQLLQLFFHLWVALHIHAGAQQLKVHSVNQAKASQLHSGISTLYNSRSTLWAIASQLHSAISIFYNWWSTLWFRLQLVSYTQVSEYSTTQGPPCDSGYSWSVTLRHLNALQLKVCPANQTAAGQLQHTWASQWSAAQSQPCESGYS